MKCPHCKKELTHEEILAALPEKEKFRLASKLLIKQPKPQHERR
jgi:hypothetical protein